MTLLQSQTALALPPPDVLSRLESSFNPVQSANASPAGRSIAFCPTLDLRLDVKDSVTQEPSFVQARVYEPLRSADRELGRTVLVMPPTGGENIFDQGYANLLCAAGFRAVILQTWHKQTEAKLDLSMHDEGAVRSLAAVRHVLNWLRPTRSSQVGLLGTSVGALSGALAMGFDSRINSAVLVVGGVGMPEIIADTDEKGAASLREARMKAFGLKSQQQYLALLRENVLIDPADFVNFSGRKKVLAFVGTKDKTVPTANQEKMARVFRAETERFAGDHLSTIKNTFFRKRPRIVDFFEKNLR